jgi:hypothetical protein
MGGALRNLHGRPFLVLGYGNVLTPPVIKIVGNITDFRKLAVYLGIE